jgi:hypothetical protein
MVSIDYFVRYETWIKDWIEKWAEEKRTSILASLKTDDYRFGSVKSFVKRDPGHKLVNKSRAIQGYRNLATQAFLGPPIYAMQKACCQVLDHRTGNNRINGIGITFASGMDSGALGTWMKAVHDRFGRPWFYERDGSNWDATMQAKHQEFVNVVYSIFPRDVYDAIQACRVVKGTNVSVDPDTRVKTTIKYTLSDTTKSGHNDTSLRNSIINAAIAYETCRCLGIKAEIIVAGDDLLLATDKKPDREAMIALEANMGISPEAGVMDDYDKVTFISGRWIKDGSEFRFVPLLGRLLKRLYWTGTTVSDKQIPSFIYGIAQGLKPTIGELPVYRALVQVPKPRKLVEIKDYGKVLDPWKNKQPCNNYPQILTDFCIRYQTTPSEVAELEKLILDSHYEPCILSHPLADRITERDFTEVHLRG